MGLLLAIETASPAGSVALVNEEGITGEFLLNKIATHAETLLPAIEALLFHTRLTLKNLDGIAVSIGPGAFTGLRVGISTAQGFAQSENIPLYPVPTIEALAYSAPPIQSFAFMTLDAKKDELYGALFRWENGKWAREIVESAASPEEWVQLLHPYIEKTPILVGGSGYLVSKEIFDKSFGDRIIPLPIPLMVPRASNVGLLGLKMEKEKASVEPSKLQPLYLRRGV